MSLVAGIRKNAIIAVAVAVWIPAVGYGVNTLWRYSTTAGHPAEPPSEWPRFAPIERAAGRSTLLIFAHPKCPCTQATLGELGIIVAHGRERVNAFVFFYRPSAEPGEWAKTDLWQAATAIPGVRAFEDRDGAVARSFGVFTSGETLLYDPAGRLQFQGGITAFRGHSGDNAGRSAITALLQGDEVPSKNAHMTAPVFGCSLRGE
jgi:hypothetical protein